MIEFILGLMIVISFFFFFVRMSMVFAAANYAHYATFMAARAYQSSAQNTETQVANATSVITAMLNKRFKTLITGKGGDGNSIPGATIGPGPYFLAGVSDPVQQDSWNQGVTFHFTGKLAMYPWSNNNQSIALDLQSESWLPREDTIDECNSKKVTTQGLLSGAGVNNVVVEWDNGC
jgi:hypothetical protein